MRIMWRGLELPSRIFQDEDTGTDSYGRFVIEPFEQGFGTTIGNSLRRVLISSLEGAAVTSVKIEGVLHEFSSIDSVMQDVVDIVLNIKGIILRLDGLEPKTMTVERLTAGEVRAGDFVTDPAVTIINPDHLIATLTADVPFRAELSVETGRGYRTGAENRLPEQEVGVISTDSVFSPVRRVRFHTEDMRVGQKTNYDRLIMEVWTNGTIKPEDALVEASLILRKHLNPFVMYQELGEDQVTLSKPRIEAVVPADSKMTEMNSKPVSVLNLSVRASNCLEAARIRTIGELVSRTEADLLRFRSFGKTSLHEVQRKLEEAGLGLGMAAGEDGVEPVSNPTSGAMAEAIAEPTANPLTESPPIEQSGEPAPEADLSGPMEAFTMGDST